MKQKSVNLWVIGFISIISTWIEFFHSKYLVQHIDKYEMVEINWKNFSLVEIGVKWSESEKILKYRSFHKNETIPANVIRWSIVIKKAKWQFTGASGWITPRLLSHLHRPTLSHRSDRKRIPTHPVTCSKMVVGTKGW